jgi:hypothetical protein
MNTIVNLPNKNLYAFLTFFLLVAVNPRISYAQASFSGSGNVIHGSNGIVCYSIGQPFTLESVGSNGSTINGIQQPYSVYTIGLDDHLPLGMEVTVFPNPTTQSLIISLNFEDVHNLKYCLYSILGICLIEKPILSKIVPINLDGYKADTYLLKVMDEGKWVKSFKIVKNK